MEDDKVNPRVERFERKKKEGLKGQLNCIICPPHRGENATRKPKHISWKKERKVKYK
jgi:hypothetical protein